MITSFTNRFKDGAVFASYRLTRDQVELFTAPAAIIVRIVNTLVRRITNEVHFKAPATLSDEDILAEIFTNVQVAPADNPLGAGYLTITCVFGELSNFSIQLARREADLEEGVL